MDLRTYLPIIPRAGWKFRSADRLIHRADRQVRLATSVYGWFTEGFDTLDLKEAKALLDALA